jgi:hypothetical protein
MKDTQLQRPHSTAGLAKVVATLEARVAALEEHLGLAVETPVSSAPPVQAEAVPREAPITPHSGPQLPSLGSAILMLAGAFLLRALTDAGILNATFGVALGLVYLLVLHGLTERAAAGGFRTRATLFGLATVLAAYPFVWETTTNLGLLPVPLAAAVVALLTALGLGIAMRHRLRGLAWVVLMAALTTCLGLYWATGASVLFSALVLALSLATVWLGYLKAWQGPQWLVALVANSLVLLTVMQAAHPAELPAGRLHPAPHTVLPLALALPVVYLGSFSLRTLSHRREAGVFEIVQSLGCLLAGYLGAVRLLSTSGSDTMSLGLATLVAAAAGHAVAFRFVRRRQGRRLNFFYYAWLGLLLTFLGTALTVPGDWLPYLWGGLGVAAAIAGGYFDRWTLRLHCAAYLIGTAVLTGLPAVVYDAFAAPAASAWRRLATPGMTSWLLAVACYGLLVATQRKREMSAWRRVPRFLLAALVLTGAGSLLVTALTAWLTVRVPGSGAATVAVVRTAVLAVTAVSLAAVSRGRLFVELAWFVNPLLVFAGLKLLLEDLRRGTSSSLFFGFTFFGIALIMAPLLRRQKARAGA